MISISDYSDKYAYEWNNFLTGAINGSFLFNRSYMDYHKDRFVDQSFMVHNDSKLIALIPGNQKENQWFSHSGLTYGGIIIQKDSPEILLKIIEQFEALLREKNIDSASFTLMPSPYKKFYFESDLYALISSGYKILGADLHQFIFSVKSLPNKKVSGAKTSSSKGYLVEKTNDFTKILELVNDRLLKKYKKKAVHTIDEMRSLSQNFPDNIWGLNILNSSEIEGGAIIYESEKVLHAQYLSTTDRARKERAQDLLLFELMILAEAKNKIFSFGSSTEKKGFMLNNSLLQAKSEFGATNIVATHFSKRINQ